MRLETLPFSVPELQILENRVLLAAAPAFATQLNDSYVFNNGSLTLGIDAFEQGGAPLTITATSNNSNVTVTTYAPATSQYAILHLVGADKTTPIGDIEVQLFQDRAPLAVQRFVKLATDTTLGTGGTAFYTNVLLHRVIKDFMIQTGDAAKSDGTGGSTLGKFSDEWDPNLSFSGPGVLAMANSGPDTNDSQFFMTAVATPWLNGRHTIFGQIISGQNYFDEIIKKPVDSNDKPTTNIYLKNVEIVQDRQAATITVTPVGNFVGSAGITIKVDDGNGGVVTKTINAVVMPTNLNVVSGQTTTFTAGVDWFGQKTTVAITSQTTQNVNISVNPTTYLATITAPTNFDGVLTFVVKQTYANRNEQTSFNLVVHSANAPTLNNGAISQQAFVYPTGDTLTAVSNNLLFEVRNSGRDYNNSNYNYYWQDPYWFCELSIFDITDPSHPQQLNTLDLPGFSAHSITVKNNILYIANEYSGLLAYDVSNPRQIVPKGVNAKVSVGDNIPVVGFDMVGDIGFVATSARREQNGSITPGSLVAYSFSDLSNATRTAIGGSGDITNFNFFSFSTVQVVDGMAYVIADTPGRTAGTYDSVLAKIDVSDPVHFKLVKAVRSTGNAYSMTVKGNRMYVVNLASLLVYDTASMKLLGKLDMQSDGPHQVTVVNDTAILAVDSGYSFVNVVNPKSMRQYYTFKNSQGVDNSVEYYAPGGLAAAGGTKLVLPFNGKGAMLFDAADMASWTTIASKGTLIDGGTTINLSVSNGIVRVRDNPQNASGRYSLEVLPYSKSSSISIKSLNGSANFNKIDVRGDIKSFTAPTSNLQGNFTAEGNVGSLTLGDIAGSAVTISGTAVSTSVKIGNVSDASLVAGAALKSLTVNSWRDTVGNSDTITAPGISTLNSAGNFNADLSVAGNISSATIGGQVAASQWTVGGTISKVTAKGDFAANLNVAGSVTSASITGNVAGSSWTVGGKIGKLTATGNSTADLTVAGDLTSASIGGDLSDSDWTITGKIGSMTVKGFADTAKVRAGSTIGTITLGGSRSSDFLSAVTTAGRYGTQGSQFGQSGYIKSVKITGMKVPPQDFDGKYFADSNFSAMNIGTVNLLAASTANSGNDFGFFANGTIKSITCKEGRTTLWSWPKKPAADLQDMLILPTPTAV